MSRGRLALRDTRASSILGCLADGFADWCGHLSCQSFNGLQETLNFGCTHVSTDRLCIFRTLAQVNGAVAL